MRKHGMAKLRGFSMIEVLITLVIVAFGLLALINLQIKMHMTEVESYQRSQAVVLLQDMANRIQLNPANAASYVTANDSWIGVTGGTDCADYPDGLVETDMCAWETLLQGAAIEQGGGEQVGAMIGARGCVEQIQSRDPTDGVCRPGIYRVSVVWQGLVESAEPAQACGADSFGDEGHRRAISVLVSLGVPGCLGG